MKGGPARRVQLSRKRGARLPPNTVVVARPSRWGNPYKLNDYVFEAGFAQDKVEAMARMHAVRDFQAALDVGGILQFTAEDVRRELRGKNLACWCKLGLPCHAGVLLVIANG